MPLLGFRSLLAGLALAWMGQIAPALAAPSRPPNIVFIHVDDLGWGDLSAYGQKKFRTPNIDRLAAEGIRFTSYYAGSTVCAPSRAALMTGRHTGHVSVRGNGELPLPASETTVAEVLRKAGYRTGIVGKWGLGHEDSDSRPEQRGFDESFSVLHHVHAHRQYTTRLWKDGRMVDVDVRRYTSDLYTDAAVAFVRRNRARPFFLYMSLPVPHAELRVPQDSLRKFRGKFPETPFQNERADREFPPEPPWSFRGYRSQAHPHAAFAAMVTRLDDHVGRMLATLRSLRLDRDTVVLFTSDNGPHSEGGADPAFFASAGPFRGKKRDMYEGGIRVPMLVRWPGRIPAGRVSDHPWAHWDILPTAAALAGTAAPGGIDGISMVDALLGRPDAPTHEALYWEFHEKGFHQAVRAGTWKGVRHGLRAPLELYDLGRDPGETTDVAARHPDVVRRLEALLASARTQPAHAAWQVE